MSELAALVRFVHLTAAILLAGGLGFRLLVAQPAFAQAKQIRRRRWNNFTGARSCAIFVGALLVLCITLPLSLWLHAANCERLVIARSSARYFSSLTETQFGRVWLIRMALLIVIAVSRPSKAATNQAPASFWCSVYTQ